MTTPLKPCSVCAEALETHTSASCSFCARDFHLNQRQDRPGKDCGQVWINEEHLGLEFGCNTCLHPTPQALEDVLTLDEAVALAGAPESSLVGAAEGGQLPHRRTSGGVYLFQRKDVLEFARKPP